MDKKLICLDTSILIDYYRKKQKPNLLSFQNHSNLQFQ